MTHATVISFRQIRSESFVTIGSFDETNWISFDWSREEVVDRSRNRLIN